MRKLIPVASAMAALIITSVLSGCGGTGVEPVTGPTTRTGAAQTSSAAPTTGSAAAVTEAAATKAAEAATVAKAKVAKAKVAAAAEDVTAARAVTAAKAKAAAAKANAAAVSPPVPATLRETCSKVEQAVSGLSGKTSPPTAAKLDAALARIKLLSAAGDTETRNALGAILGALPGYRDADPAGVSNDARRAFLISLTNLANRCEAVGSSALRWVG